MAKQGCRYALAFANGGRQPKGENRMLRVPSIAKPKTTVFALSATMPPLSQQTPEELAVRAQQGGGPAVACFGELVTRFHTRLFHFLLRRTRSRADAEELTQEAFTRAWERLHSYDPGWKFSTWLYTIAARLAVSKHRKLHREVVVEAFDRSGSLDTDRLAQHEDKRAGQMLWQAAEKELSRDQYTALWLRYVEDMSIGEIARVLGKAEVGVRVSLFRARAALAKRAQREGWLPLIDIRSDVSAAARGALHDDEVAQGARGGVA
jgi:RNA polymerase sigma-70 factor, ECF subfamily